MTEFLLLYSKEVVCNAGFKLPAAAPLKPAYLGFVIPASFILTISNGLAQRDGSLYLKKMH